MVEMKKGKLTLTIPAGAVRKYIKAGWEPTHSSGVIEGEEKGKLNSEIEEELEEVLENESEDGEYEEDVEYVDPEELAQKPLNELDKEELRILAEYKGIDVSELSTAKQLRSALRSLE